MEKISIQQSHNSSRIEINTEEEIKSVNNYNTNRERNYTNFSKTIIETYEATPSLQKMELNRQKNEFHISQVINHYNNIKSKNKINNQSNLNNSNNNKDSHINNIPKPMTSRNQNNKIISTGKILPLNLLEIHSNNGNDSDNNINNNSPCFSIKYIKNNSNIGVDILKIFFGIIRINLFSDYLIKCANILNDYKINASEIKKEKNKLFFWENDLKLDKNVYLMKKYILEKIEQMPNFKNNNQVKNYINYLKNEIEKGKLIYQSESSELNYIFTYFAKGIDIQFDFDNLEFIYYSIKNNKYCGKGIINSPKFNFRINHSNINLKLYDFEIDFSDLENANILFTTMHNIFEEKLKFSKILIEPCLQKIKNELEKKEKEKEKEREKEREIEKEKEKEKEKELEITTEKIINEDDEPEKNLNIILNNNIKPKNIEIKPKINANKIITENIKKLNNNNEKEKKIISKKETSEKELFLKINDELKEIEINKNKEIKDNKLLNKNNKDSLLLNEQIINNNNIIHKENKAIPYEKVDLNKKKKLIHKKNSSREKRKATTNLKSKTIELTKKNSNKSTILTSANGKEEKENKKMRLSKKSSNSKIDGDKKGKDYLISSKLLVPNKKRTTHAIKKVQLKNIDKKQNKNNKTDNNI